jgi:hypothetical protein
LCFSLLVVLGEINTQRWKLPKRSKIAGNNNKFNNVDEAKPPIMMAAMGPMISRPGLSLSKAIGDIAKAVTKAVISIEGKRS